jgi:hypothetical protein
MSVPEWEDVQPEQEQQLFPPVPAAAQVPPAILLADNSPLCDAMPARLNVAQMMVLDGITTSVDVIMIAYRDLQVALLESHRSTDQHRPPSRAVRVSATMNAWTVVDAAHRLGLLVPKLPGLKHGPAYTSLLKSVAPVEPFRHVVQHLNKETGRLLSDRQPIWGSLSWTYLESPHAEMARIGLLMPGAARAPIELPLVDMRGKRIEIPIGLVTLAAAGKTVCLSDIVSAVRRFAARLERAAAAAFAALPDSLGAEASFDLRLD